MTSGGGPPIGRRALLMAGAAVPVAALYPALARTMPPADPIDWPAFLARHDLVWDRLPRNWGEAAFMGNGRLALSMRASDDGRAIVFPLDNVDIFDRRDASWGWPAYARSRHHPGDFVLTPAGAIREAHFRLDLWHAELRGTVTTDRGTIELTARVQADAPVAVISMTTTGDEDGGAWRWQPTPAVSTRPPIRTAADQATYQKTYGRPVRIWRDNPPGHRDDAGPLARWVQPLLAGGGYTTAWQEDRDGRERHLYIANAMSWPALDSPARAARAIRAARAASPAALRDRHRAWWQHYYPASFVTLPDTQLESFYWIQMYKYGCIARPDAGVIDTHGPWLQPSTWPYLTWNLNVQLSYYALQPANRLALAEGLFGALDNHRQTLRDNARPATRDGAAIGHCSQQDYVAPLDMDQRYAREWGNLLWVCHLYWLQYRFTMDRAMLRDRLLPLLREAVAFYLPALHDGADGRIHLAPTYSPETATTADCNYDLALLKWASGVLREHGHGDPHAARWAEIADRLVPFPADADGYRIGADLAVPPHRHFSHLLMIWPLYLVNRDTPEARPLIERSVDHWLALARQAGQASGFTLAAGASFQAALGRGDAALDCLAALLGGANGIGRSFPNTMYAESGQNIETPLAAAQAVNDMLLQSWGGALRIFPAVPRAWPDLAFRTLRGEGGFLVSAVRRGGRLQWLEVTSLAGEPCVVEADWQGATPRHLGAGTVRQLSPTRVALTLRPGERAILHRLDATPPFSVAALPAQPGTSNSYGVHGVPKST